MSKPIYTTDQVAYQLTHAFYAHTSVGGGRSFDVEPGDVLRYDASDLGGADRALARQALDTWTDISGIQFQATSGPANIKFTDIDSGAYASTSVSGSGTIRFAYINIGDDWTRGPYRLQTYIHEIGHALGLGHGGRYNGSANYSQSATYANDTWQMSVMSYFHQGQDKGTDARFTYLATPMLADALAIHNLYGTPDNVRTGDTVYGDGSTAGNGMDLAEDRARTIVDSGGIDTIDLGRRSADQRIALAAEEFSDVSGRAGNLVIARGTVIENATTGSGNDVVTGNAADNVIRLGAGDDAAFGRSGNDTIRGGSGDDTIDGGSGRDLALFGGAAEGYAVELRGGGLVISGADGTDVLRSIETVRFSDRSVEVSDVVAELQAIGSAGAVSLGRVIARIESPVVVADKPKVVAPDPDPDPVTGDRALEVGSARIDRDGDAPGWVRISFSAAIDDPVVVVGPMTRNGSDPAVLQVRDVDSRGFDVRIQEFDYLDGSHVFESFSWMAGTRGMHQMGDGTRIELGSTRMVGLEEVETVAFGDGFDAPVFLGSLHGAGSATPGLRVRALNDDRARVEMQGEEGFAGREAGVARTLDWAAVEAGSGRIVETGRTGVSDKGTGVRVDGDDALFAEMQTRNGGDLATLRASRSDDRTVLVAAEEQSADDEIAHAVETVGWAGVAEGRHGLTTITSPGPGSGAGTGPGGGTAGRGMEVGTVTIDRKAGSDGWVRVTFDEAISDAVVVVGPVGAADGAMVTAQVRDIDSRGFFLRLNEWNYQDDVHGAESITWVAGSLGSHVTDDGTKVSFGQASVGTSLRSYDIAAGAPDEVVFGTVFGDGEDAVALRIEDVRDGRFEARIQMEQAEKGDPDGARSIGWMSVDADAVTSAMINHEDRRTGLPSDGPFLAGMQTSNGGETAVLRYETGRDGAVSLRVEEERSADGEIAHAVEQVAWLALDPGRSALRSADPLPDFSGGFAGTSGDGAHDPMHGIGAGLGCCCSACQGPVDVDSFDFAVA